MFNPVQPGFGGFNNSGQVVAQGNNTLANVYASMLNAKQGIAGDQLSAITQMGKTGVDKLNSDRNAALQSAQLSLTRQGLEQERDIELQKLLQDSQLANQGFDLQRQGLGLDREKLQQQQLAQQLQQEQYLSQLGLDRQKLSQQQSQFNQGFGLDQQRMAQQQSQFNQGLGLDQQRMQQQQGQFGQNLGLDQQRLAEMQRSNLSNEAIQRQVQQTKGNDKAAETIGNFVSLDPDQRRQSIAASTSTDQAIQADAAFKLALSNLKTGIDPNKNNVYSSGEVKDALDTFKKELEGTVEFLSPEQQQLYYDLVAQYYPRPEYPDLGKAFGRPFGTLNDMLMQSAYSVGAPYFNAEKQVAIQNLLGL